MCLPTQANPVIVFMTYCPGGQAERRQDHPRLHRVLHAFMHIILCMARIKNDKAIVITTINTSCIQVYTYSIHQGLESMNEAQEEIYNAGTTGNSQ